MKMKEAVRRLLGLGRDCSHSDENSRENSEPASVPAPNNRGGSIRRRFKIGTAVSGVILALTLIKVLSGTLVELERIHDLGGLCSLDVVRVTGTVYEVLCPSSD